MEESKRRYPLPITILECLIVTSQAHTHLLVSCVEALRPETLRADRGCPRLFPSLSPTRRVAAVSHANPEFAAIVLVSFEVLSDERENSTARRNDDASGWDRMS